MKKFFVFCITSVLMSAWCAFAVTYMKGANVYVSVKQTELRSGTGRFSSVLSVLEYGDSLVVVESGDKNTKVRMSDGQEGWVSTHALTKKKITKSGDGDAAKASTKEIALAGKGFSEESEKAYQQANSTLDFSKVDEIEKISVPDEVLDEFITDGKLNDGGWK